MTDLTFTHGTNLTIEIKYLDTHNLNSLPFQSVIQQVYTLLKFKIP